MNMKSTLFFLSTQIFQKSNIHNIKTGKAAIYPSGAALQAGLPGKDLIWGFHWQSIGIP